MNNRSLVSTMIFVVLIVLLIELQRVAADGGCYATDDVTCNETGSIEYVCGNSYRYIAPEGSDVLIMSTTEPLSYSQIIATGEVDRVAIVGDWVIMYVGDEPQAVRLNRGVECPEDEHFPTHDGRVDVYSNIVAVYPTDTGVEIYCIQEGVGDYGGIIDADTGSGTVFPCAVFYILDTGEYQLNLSDGSVMTADNIQFVGWYEPSN